MAERSPEIQNDLQYSGTKFETAIHFTLPQALKIARRIKDNGELDLNIWQTQKELKSRVQVYSPKIVAVDSQSAYNPEDELAKAYMFASLPARPSLLNSEKRVLLVRGDLIGEMPINLFKLDSNELDPDKWMNQSLLSVLEQASYAPIIYSILAGSIMGVEALHKGSMTRRDFLKRAGLFGAGWFAVSTASISLTPIDQSAKASTPKDRDYWLKVEEFLRPRLFKKTSVDARTAIVWAKYRDSIDTLNLDKSVPGALVFGAVHGSEQNIILNDKDDSGDLIRQDVREMMTLLMEIHSQNNNFDLSVAKLALFDFVETFDVWKISESLGGAKDFSDVKFDLAVPKTKSPRVAHILESLKDEFKYV